MKMRRLFQSTLVFVLAALALLLLPYHALAGGWAVTTLDSLPGQVVAGEPMKVGFIIRQHGRTPWISDGVVVHAVNQGSGQKQVFPAVAEGEPGHYVSTLTFDKPGAWEWGIASGLYPDVQWMPDLEVLSTAAVTAPDPGGIEIPIAAGAVGILAAALALLWLAKQRSLQRQVRWGAVLALVALLLVGAVGLARAAASRGSASAPQSKAGFDQDQVAYGEALFIAKGCVMCHENRTIASQTGLFNDSEVPDLTNYKGSPDFLRVWLKDPSAVRPNTYMPDLGLKETEIEALIKYLNSERGN
jgi:cytochrome c2